MFKNLSYYHSYVASFRRSHWFIVIHIHCGCKLPLKGRMEAQLRRNWSRLNANPRLVNGCHIHFSLHFVLFISSGWNFRRYVIRWILCNLFRSESPHSPPPLFFSMGRIWEMKPTRNGRNHFNYFTLFHPLSLFKSLLINELVVSRKA